MNVLLSIPFEQLKDLVDQLPTEEKSELLNHLLSTKDAYNPLSSQSKRQLLDAMSLDLGKVLSGYSDRREDRYRELVPDSLSV